MPYCTADSGGLSAALLDANQGITWESLVTYNGDILGAGDAFLSEFSRGVLQLTGTGPADWALEQLYTSNSALVRLILWQR